MLIEKKVRELMIPIKDYAVTSPDKTLQEAILEMRRIYCEVETGKCTEAGHRTSLVLKDGKLEGIIDFQCILRALMPEIAGKLSDKLAALGLSIAFAEADASDLDEAKSGFQMHRNKVTVLPVYEGDNVVGVLRDSDLFLATANILAD
jgi:CBS domain-containing protein